MDEHHKVKFSTGFAMNILIHVIMLFSFLSLFFFLYVSKIEEKAFKQEFGNIIETSLNEFIENNKILKPEIKDLSPWLSQVENMYSDYDRATKERDILVKFSSVFVLLILLSIFITIVLTLFFGCDKRFSLNHIIIENTIVFILIGIVEYTFFTKVAIKFIPTPPSLLVNTLIDTIKQQLIMNK